MSEPLYVQPDGVRSYAQIHDEVVAGLTQLIGATAPEAAGVQTSHGDIASAVSAALSAVLVGRQGTLQTTSTSGSTISELLQKAAQMYEQGDQKGAAKLRAAAEELEGANAAGGPGAAGTSGSPGSGGGSGSGGEDMMGQMLGQVGQVGQQAGQLGQMAQSVAQPLQGLAQGLQQLPQQVMQGVQQAAQQASKSAEKAVDTRDAGQANPTAPQQDSDDEAAPGESANTGRAPEPAERAQPAQTRPQAD
ncbi:type VII secretion target [Mycolicibacterium moriokaense]|uniref:Excreted virulence factor EspC (Type VII ESX diderm) n=1 Tax=Mycolicibacterium moriokaense TaxID=39691 RepID=A0A318HT64_9MYCO|nr:type VII secretion target [Mycolicibacterium moriokaense]PXX08181.1 excreted virulence factor EspC (type VII ESX diderm) [Mycolicibacterium moriokaense]